MSRYARHQPPGALGEDPSKKACLRASCDNKRVSTGGFQARWPAPVDTRNAPVKQTMNLHVRPRLTARTSPNVNYSIQFSELYGRFQVEKITYEVIEQIRDVDLFANLGKPTTLEVSSFPHVHQLSSLDQVEENLKSLQWENFMLETRNGISLYLHYKFPNQLLNWNVITKQYKTQLHHFEPALSTLPESLKTIVPDSFNWNILAACMESHYRKTAKHLPLFFTHLLTVYKAGHLPCGWLGAIELDEKTHRINTENGLLLIY
jgi:hypothetical protein